MSKHLERQLYLGVLRKQERLKHEKFNKNFIGHSGKEYPFIIQSIELEFNELPGIYIFTNNQGKVIYIGQTGEGELGNFRGRLTTNHEKWKCGLSNGMTHIALHVTHSNIYERTAIETDLRNGYPDSPCNKQSIISRFRKYF